MTFEYGKYKGQDIVDVPVNYLIWMEESCELTDQQREDINYEINRRSGDRPGQGRTVRDDELERGRHRR
jgi:hypothetical protein